MDVNELEVEIKNVKAKVAELENRYAAEDNEQKANKLEYAISRQDDVLDKLIDRQQVLLDKEEKQAINPDNGNDKNAEEEDEDVCPVCGSDLYEDEEGILYCHKCKEWYEKE